MDLKFQVFANLDEFNRWYRDVTGTGKVIIEIQAIETRWKTGQRAVHYFEVELG